MNDDLVRAEFLKIRTTSLVWTFSAGVLVSLVAALLTTVISAKYSIDAAVNPPELPPEFQGGPGYVEQFDLDNALLNAATGIYTSGQFLGLLLVLLLGLLLVTNEFHHSTATATFLTTPRRTPVIVAKLLVAIFVAAGVWLFTTAVDLVVGLIFFGSVGQPNGLDQSVVWQTIMLSLLAYVVWAVFGVGLGVLLRSQLGATVAALMLYLISLPLAYAVFGMIRQYLIDADWVWTAMVIVPGVASQVATSLEPPFDHAPAAWVGALVLAGYGLLAGVIGTAAIRRADIG